MKRNSLYWHAFVLAEVGMLMFGLSVAGAMPNACKVTSTAVLHSGVSGAWSDYLLALGRSDNLTDPVARNAGKKQARADLDDALAAVKEQFAARNAACTRLGGKRYDPVINPSNFVSTIDNPFLPLTPGTTFMYLSSSESNVVTVTHSTRVILGVTCVEVHDVVYVDGKRSEDTRDWFAQDKDGNVWYFGENSNEVADGLVVSVEGSWTGGVDSAKPGIVMKAHPAVGDFYRQEFLLGEAEDLAEVARTNQSTTVPYGSFTNCVETKETSPLEPDALEHKSYAAGVGLVLVFDDETGERLELVQVTHE